MPGQIPTGILVAEALYSCMYAAEGAWKAFYELPASSQKEHAP